MHVGFPRDAAQLAALVVAAALLVAARPLLSARPRTFVAAAATLAAALSALYVVFYLRGGPRIIDATAYFLEGRALSDGQLTFPLGEPAASTMGRFLVRPEGDPTRAAVIFPPGYPALLAVGFTVGAPMAIGPLLAAAVV